MTGEIVQDTIRAGAELEREQAYAAVRRARIDNDSALLAEVDGLDHDLVLRYRQVDTWRDLIQRWGDGERHVPSVIAAQLPNQSAWAATTGRTRLAPGGTDTDAGAGEAL